MEVPFAWQIAKLLVSVGIVLGLSPEYRQVGRAQSQPDAVPAYVLSAERFMQDSLQEQIGMDDIVRQSGVPRRTLFAGFRKHRGTTPMARLKAMRLKAVKAALPKCRVLV